MREGLGHQDDEDEVHAHGLQDVGGDTNASSCDFLILSLLINTEKRRQFQPRNSESHY